MLMNAVILNGIALAHKDSSSGDVVPVEQKHVENALIRHQNFKKYIDGVKQLSEKSRGYKRVEEKENEW